MFEVKVHVIAEIPVIDVQIGFADGKIDSGLLLFGSHFGKIMWIFPSTPIVLVRTSVNLRDSVAPTVEVAEAKVTVIPAGVAVSV